MTQSAGPFLDLPTLLETSQPRRPLGLMRVGMLFVLAAVIFLVHVSRTSQANNQWASMLWMLLLAGAVSAMWVAGYLTGRGLRDEQVKLEAIDELVQLRRWPEAALVIQSFLSRPARNPAARAQAILFLAMVLARYHRFEDSVAAHDYLLREIPLDDVAAHAVRVGRAMALLRDDRLLDADRAIAELRRESRGSESAGLSLVEIYRDVKTGHPAEAIEMFEKSTASLRRNLGHRAADAWALAARAYDLLGNAPQAASAYENATLLAPVAELRRRYPEIAPLAEKFPAAQVPAEVAS